MADWWAIYELDVLRWLHILAMVYWLGGEWGVFQASYKVVDPKLGYDERRRHMDTAFRIDILARTGIISLLPLGLHMGFLWGLQPLGGAWLAGMWALWGAWMGLTWAAFATRGRPVWRRLSKIEDWTRYIVIPALLLTGAASLLGSGPFASGPGQAWYAAKVLTYGAALVIGLVMRTIMHGWEPLFARLAQGSDAAAEAMLDRSIRIGRGFAYLYWILIGGACFLASVKPF